MWGKVRKRSKLFSELWRLKIRTSLHNLARKKPTDSWTFTFSTLITTSSPFGTGSGSCSVQSRCTNISFPIELHQKNSMCGKTPYYPFNWMWYSTVIEDTGSNHCHKLTLHNIARPCKTMQCYVRSFQVTWEVANTSKVGPRMAKSYYLGEWVARRGGGFPQGPHRCWKRHSEQYTWRLIKVMNNVWCDFSSLGGGKGALTCKQLVRMNFMGYISGPRWVKFLRKKNIINVI